MKKKSTRVRPIRVTVPVMDMSPLSDTGQRFSLILRMHVTKYVDSLYWKLEYY